MRNSVHGLFMLTVGILLASPAGAQDFPRQPIRLIVPFAPGGPADAIARVVADRMSSDLGQPILIENQGGAGGVIGTDIVAKSTPDGHVLAMSSAGALAIGPSVLPSMPFDPEADLAPVSLLASVPELLVVGPGLDVDDLDGLVAYAKAHPGELNFASSGVGSMPHLAGELLNMSAGIETIHVPYSGAAPAVTELLGGQVQMMFADMPVLLSHVASGALKALAIGSKERWPALPNVSTTAELGYPEIEAENWYAIVAPAGTPDEVVSRINAAVVAAVQDEAVIGKLEAQGARLIGSTPEALTAYMASEKARWAEIVERSGASAD